MLLPMHYENAPRTRWTSVGAQKWFANRGNDAVTYIPGIDYEVLPCADGSYITFPEEPRELFCQFRHRWIILRRKRPVLPV